MEISPELLAVLRCPQSGQPLAIASDEVLETLNRDRADDPPLEGGLLREDGTLLYPIIDGFPILLIEQAIDIAPQSRSSA